MYITVYLSGELDLVPIAGRWALRAVNSCTRRHAHTHKQRRHAIRRSTYEVPVAQIGASGECQYVHADGERPPAQLRGLSSEELLELHYKGNDRSVQNTAFSVTLGSFPRKCVCLRVS